MKTLQSNLADQLPTEAPPLVVNLAGIAELYAAGIALEPNDPKALDGLGDLSRVTLATNAGTVRQLMHALATMRAAPTNTGAGQ